MRQAEGGMEAGCGEAKAGALERGYVQMTRSQLLFTSKLLGFKSLWMTLAEWMYLSPRRIW